MAAHVTSITLSNGDTLSLAGNSTAINSPLNCSITGPATSASPIDVTFGRDTYISDIITSATAGEIEIFSNEQRSGKKIPLDARWVVTQYRKVPRIGFKAGKIYRFVATVVTS